MSEAITAIEDELSSLGLGNITTMLHRAQELEQQQQFSQAKHQYSSAVQTMLSSYSDLPPNTKPRVTEAIPKIVERIEHIQKQSVQANTQPSPYFVAIYPKQDNQSACKSNILHILPSYEEVALDQIRNPLFFSYITTPPSYEELFPANRKEKPLLERRTSSFTNRESFTRLKSSILRNNQSEQMQHHLERNMPLIANGIQLAVSKQMNNELLEHKENNFALACTYRFTTDGSYHSIHGVSYHSDCDFVFTDYAQICFRNIRRNNGITCENYIKSFCNDEEYLQNVPNQSTSHVKHTSLLKLIKPEGKSPSHFFITSNCRYIIKSLLESEFTFLLSILENYYYYLMNHRNSLLNRYYGLFRLQYDNQDYYYCVMNNLIPLPPSLLANVQRYDLKGSIIGRSASLETRLSGGVLKDLDFPGFLLDPARQASLLRTLREDCEFLEFHSIMDYSLLVGVREFDLEKEYDKGTLIGSDPTGRDLPVAYYIGIIDILQVYDMRKKMETALKTVRHDPELISCVNPATYANRFLTFVESKMAIGRVYDSTSESLAPAEEELSPHHNTVTIFNMDRPPLVHRA